MQNSTSVAAPGTDRFDHVEGLVARYPDISPAEIAELKTWFASEASAFDVASLASKESIHGAYTAFRSEHIDAFGRADYLKLVATLILVAVTIVVLML